METYNGHLVNCDTWMNIPLREVICTSKDGDRFWRMPECYIRGNTIKYLRVPDEVDILNLKYLFLPLEWIGMNAMLVYVMAAGGIFAGFINGWYYEDPHSTLIYWIKKHIFIGVWHSTRVGTLLYVIFVLGYCCWPTSLIKHILEALVLMKFASFACLLYKIRCSIVLETRKSFI
ncbi:hypothetical protein R3W88_002995 [Solanum pinnatisectum]|uniref:U6 snRNA-associated Sm-like protein LSm4 n=1 Tax=Solanum pinnatisectum TaxID=50273 RepID=A0AAV9MMR8_9SOLN|nr:hypothetical protein R3W88_002995 [Solanum pinnatisectum]